MTQLLQRLNEVGPYFMYPALIILIIILILITKAFLNLKNDNSKNINLISSIGLFALIWGFLGQLIGLIQAFDYIQLAGEIPTTILAGGLKVSMISTTFGAIIFLISRLGVITLTWIKK
ncbi:MAG: biopolymer transporter ExbD [Lutibacter sp.]|nr:MAG: biopolymer transporter ExbD [Lutibacter sp.]